MYWQKIWVCGYLKNVDTAVCKEEYLQGYTYATGFERQHEPGMANRGRALPVEYFATHWGHSCIVMAGPARPSMRQESAPFRCVASGHPVMH